MRLTRLRFGLGAIACACQPAATSAPAPARCGPSVPPTAQHPIAIRTADLAGDYDLIQVQSQPAGGAIRSGRLHLTPQDSAARVSATGRPVRDLVGWLTMTGGDTTRLSAAASRDPGHPGAVLAGDHLRLGDIGAFDGYIEDLTITAVAPEGFWGWWRANPGGEIMTDPATRRVLPDAAGYFCALRRDSDR